MRQVGPVRGDPTAELPPANRSWCGSWSRQRRPGPRVEETPSELGDATLCVHAGSGPDPATGAVGTAVVHASTFVLGGDQYDAIEHGFARDRFIYARYGSPNQWAVQNKLAALEGAPSALVFSSGMAAIATTVAALLDRGGHVVTSRDLYGGTYNLFEQELPNLGMRATFVEPRDLAAVEAAIEPETQLLLFELVSNPLLKVVDLDGLVAIARRHGLRLVVDATFATPLGCRPLAFGADVVVHSASKYLGGHSDLIAGAACGSRKLVDRIWARLLNFGGSLDPHACFLLERGLKTLHLRMRAHWQGARTVARFLAAHPKIRRVLHPDLPDHPDHARAVRQLEAGGGMVTFFVQDDAAALALVDSMRLITQATSLGGVESLVSLPFNTSHAAMTPAGRSLMGIEPGCVRLSVGVEDPDDLVDDLQQALARLP